MTTYVLQGPPHAGGTINMVTPGGTIGDLVPTGQGQALLVQNSAGTAISIVLPITNTYDGLSVANRVFSLPAATGAVNMLAIIPVPDSVYGPGTTSVQYSVTFNLQVAAVRIP